MLEFENNVLVRQLLVDRRERLSLVLNLLLTLSTEEHLDGLTSLAADGGLLANALARIHQILNDGLVDRGQRVAVGADTVELVGTAVVLAQDGSLGDEHHGATLELLLQFSGEAGLNQSESLEELVGHEDDDGLLVSGDVHFLSSGHLEGLERLSEILRLLGDLSDFVGNGSLEVVSLNSSGLGDEFHGLHDGEPYAFHMVGGVTRATGHKHTRIAQVLGGYL